MIGPLSNTNHDKLKNVISNGILKNFNFAERILEAKKKWHDIENKDKADKVVQDKGYYAKQFGLEAEEIFESIFSKSLAFESLKKILIDENHSKDLSIGDFVFRWLDGSGSFLIDTKFCYTNTPGCYGSFNLNNVRSFSGWNLCFSTDCDSALLIYIEYIRDLVNSEKLKSLDKYLYKDYKDIVEDGIKLGYIIKIDKDCNYN